MVSLEPLNPGILDPSISFAMKHPGLYIHIPFCLRKCAYCDFYSVTSISHIPDFLKALFKEMGMVWGQFPPIDTVYLGGGTPSVLSVSQLRDVLTKVQENFTLLPDTEITVEVNPGDLDPVFLKQIHTMGVNRINIGVQSFDQSVLDFLGRRHSVEQAVAGTEASREAGFENVGIDLIYGVPGQTMDPWLKTLEQALRFIPEHLSCYQLTVEERTPLGRRCKAGEVTPPGEDLQYEFFMKTSEFLEDAGYIHYEVSNFAKGLRFTSRHNQKYWDHTPYLGLGPAAHSFRNNQRWWNYRSLDQYIASIESGNPPVEGLETLTREQLRLEAFSLGLRTKKGICLQDFAHRYQCHLLSEKKTILDHLEEEGFISLEDGYLFPTRSGLAIADSLALI
jgi:oxygen-independent coproporphyrinogen-3 oxidase